MNFYWIIAIIAMLCWSGSDIFSKIGSPQNDKNSHFKVGIAVGLVMGLHAIYMVTLGGVHLTIQDIINYLPASFFYILSMVIGYIGLRYIELSISSPICNGSGAVTAILCMLVYGVTFNPDNDGNEVFLNIPIIIGIILIVAGIIALGIIDNVEDPELRMKRQQTANRKYSKSWLAILLPVLYCIIDSCGSFVDDIITGGYTDTFATANKLSIIPEIKSKLSLLPKLDSASIDEVVKDATNAAEFAAELESANLLNTAYEFTWFAIAIVFAIYVFVIKRQKITPKADGTKLLGGICETIGQVFYMMIVASDYTQGFVIISAYCAVSSIWGSIFLKEKLSAKHYIALAAAFAGILILGFYDV